MAKKPGGPRQERQRLERIEAAEHGYTRPAAALDEPRPTLAPEFAGALQVTETERAWIREHCAWFVEHRLIRDVTRRIKAGKEATVYLCSADPSSGRAWVAAKLYREWSLRGSQNMAMYQQGRELLDADGNAAQGRSRRPKATRSGKTSKHDQTAAQTSWLMHEFSLLETLHAAGADVPQPIEHHTHALLMEYVGDEAAAAPTLNDVQLEPEQAKRLFERVVFNVELLLSLGWVHGDLSEYNILYDRGRIVLIDFPQVASCHANPKARALFERDIERVARYFERWGHPSDARRLAHELWSRHVSDEPPRGVGEPGDGP